MSVDDPRGDTARRRGLSGAVVAATLVLANATNYAFQVVTGRNLSVEEYADLAVYVGTMAVITVATSALQTTSARAVAAGEVDLDGPRYFDQLTRTALVLVAFGIVAALVLSPLATSVLHFGFVPTMVLGAYVLPASLDSVAAGRLQGARRFAALGVYSASQALGKFTVVIVGLALGFSVPALVAAIVVSSTVVAAVGRLGSSRTGAIRAHALGRDTRMAFIALTLFWLALSTDLLLARRRMDALDAGVYVAGAVLGKAVLWLPATVAQMLFPSLVARGAQHDAAGAMRKAVVLTLGIAVLSVAGLAVVGGRLYSVLYGERYQGASRVSWQIGLAMIPMAMLNLLMFERLSRRSGGFIAVLAAGAVVQIVVMASIPPTPGWFALTIGTVGGAMAGTIWWWSRSDVPTDTTSPPISAASAH